MLLRFGVTNHRSLRDHQELSLVASSLGGPTAGLIPCRQVPGGHLLPVVVTYGANASGKSNLVSALRWMRSAVLYSHSRGEPDGGVPRAPFALDPASTAVPSHMEMDFVVNDVRYHYGFEATNDVFTAEWLFAFPNEKRQTLFERNGFHFRFGRNLKGRNQIISELTRPNSLFLSAAAQNGHEELTRVSSYFKNIMEEEVAYPELAENLSDKTMDARIIQFLKASGTGILGYRIKNTDTGQSVKKIDSSTSLEDIMKQVRQEFGQTGMATVSKFSDGIAIFRPMGHEPTQLQLAHSGVKNEAVYLDIAEESEGTQRLLGLLIPVFHALDTGGIMVVDELDASLHTHACEMLIALFSSPETNPKGAQLIATTHDTNLLTSRHLRRDQIWLTEKDPEGATHLYPLTDFRTREGDNLERGYLQGRFGAIPFSGRIADILTTS